MTTKRIEFQMGSVPLVLSVAHVVVVVVVVVVRMRQRRTLPFVMLEWNCYYCSNRKRPIVHPMVDSYFLHYLER